MCWAPPLPELSEFHLGTAILFCRNATATGLRFFESIGSCGIRLIQNNSPSINQKFDIYPLKLKPYLYYYYVSIHLSKS